jgi:uncharacterized protein (TIGR01777 family)
MEILCLGCTGFVGTAVRRALCDAGHRLLVVSRLSTPSPHKNESWISIESDWMDHLCKVDALVNFAGEPISRFWLSDEVNNAIRGSRVGLCSRIVDRLGRMGSFPTVWINASAVGIYGNRGEEILTEAAGPGKGYLAEVCSEWEGEVERCVHFGTREVRLRLGPVLGKGGLLRQLEPVYRMGLGGRIGSGEQYVPWVHLEDVVRATLFALENQSMRGPCNVVSPGIVRQKDFSRSLGLAWRSRVQISLPEYVVNHLPGTLTELMAFSQRAIPEALQQNGFRFVQTNLDECLADV